MIFLASYTQCPYECHVVMESTLSVVANVKMDCTLLSSRVLSAKMYWFSEVKSKLCVHVNADSMTELWLMPDQHHTAIDNKSFVGCGMDVMKSAFAKIPFYSFDCPSRC